VLGHVLTDQLWQEATATRDAKASREQRLQGGAARGAAGDGWEELEQPVADPCGTGRPPVSLSHEQGAGVAWGWSMLGNRCWASLNQPGPARRWKAAQAVLGSGGGRQSELKCSARHQLRFWRSCEFQKQELFYFPFCPPPTKFCLLGSICLNDCLQGKEHCSFCVQGCFLLLAGSESDDICVFNEDHKKLHVAFFSSSQCLAEGLYL